MSAPTGRGTPYWWPTVVSLFGMGLLAYAASEPDPNVAIVAAGFGAMMGGVPSTALDQYLGRRAERKNGME